MHVPRKLFYVETALQPHSNHRAIQQMAPPRRPPVKHLPAPAAEPTLGRALQELNGTLILICIPSRCAFVERLVSRMGIPAQRFIVIRPAMKEQIDSPLIADMIERGMLSPRFPGILDFGPRPPEHLEDQKQLRGRVACALSHRLAHETFLRSAFDTALIIEDDVRLDMAARGKQEAMYDVLVRSKRNWDVMYLGSCYEYCSYPHTPCVWTPARTLLMTSYLLLPCCLSPLHATLSLRVTHVCMCITRMCRYMWAGQTLVKHAIFPRCLHAAVFTRNGSSMALGAMRNLSNPVDDTIAHVIRQVHPLLLVSGFAFLGFPRTQSSFCSVMNVRRAWACTLDVHAHIMHMRTHIRIHRGGCRAGSLSRTSSSRIAYVSGLLLATS